MGHFSDQARKKLSGNYEGPSKDVEFSCDKCHTTFIFIYDDIYLKKSGDIEFVPEPSCPKCGSKKDLYFTDHTQRKIELMLTAGLIKKT